MDKSSNIDDSTNSSEIEDSLDVAAYDWNRIIDAANKTGYREGIEDGSESVFQESFDKGYEDAFKTAFTLGKYKSLKNAMPQNTEHPADINEILDKTRRGACYLCKLESESTNDDNIQKMSFADIINDQQKHSADTIDRLHKYFQPVVERLNINMADATKKHNFIQPSQTE